MKRIGIIGSTGSIGRQALDVIGRNPGRFDVVFLSCNGNLELLKQQGELCGAKYLCSTGLSCEGVLCGESEILKIMDSEGLDMVLLAAVGAAGTVYAYETVKRGITLALANKESIVASGRILFDTAKKTGARILPVDSEHSAIFQCLEGQDKRFLERVTLTASGGAFRNTPADALEYVTVEQALRHPNWSMGSKITVDSATMMNKGLELIEARYLFDIDPSMLSVVIHPQSVVHSFVSFRDGSIIAQMGEPDMRTPIAYAMAYPERMESGVKPLNLASVGCLTFLEPDMGKYPCLGIAVEVLKKDSNAPMIVMNAANEVAVAEFIGGQIEYSDIAKVISAVLDVCVPAEPAEIADVLAADMMAREASEKIIKRFYR
ncbi:1-deoxy-D-xylulose-5-phosphate reductoisomerase [Seleniivibrio woodruffii]|uniref:1-deoxy-D-xylulose-5-phosphate reductoisomerase n=1 Tax=Seleniivibrio woodruffii TaxID=1078050 RepID=UPI0026E9D2F1|nr:1-deoxy-D-xylulose-5-phosphate reductoisomerase [Seleniivibrio woodruffii]